MRVKHGKGRLKPQHGERRACTGGSSNHTESSPRPGHKHLPAPEPSSSPPEGLHSLSSKTSYRKSEASKPRDSGLDFSNCSEIWHAPQQQCCRDVCQISERYDHYNIQSHGFRHFTKSCSKTSHHLVNRGPAIIQNVSCLERLRGAYQCLHPRP